MTFAPSPWPDPDWEPVQPFPFSAARKAFAGMTSTEGRIVLRYYRRADGALTATAEFGPLAEGALGLVHGGALLTALDEALGAAAWLSGLPSLTVRLETEFRKGVPLDTRCLILTRLISVRHGIADLEGELRGADGTVFATARGRFKRLSEEACRRIFGRSA